MCTVVILRRPGNPWPVLLAANRDEMEGRFWLPPARHWPDRADVIGGLDQGAGGTWLAMNDVGVVAAVLNRTGTLGPAAGKRSRGELPLEALDHADAVEAARALIHLDGRAWRPFNMVVADNRDGFWLRSDGTGPVTLRPLPEGLSMLTGRELNDPADPRIARVLPELRAAPAPDPDSGDWSGWQTVLARRGDPSFACFQREDGFGTRSSALIAVPAIGRRDVPPVWLFAPGPPDVTPYAPVRLDCP